MKGGYQILDLSSITLVKDTETTITDSNILDQLLGLTDFLNENGLIDKQLKPIYVITKDSAGYVSITNNDTNKLLIDGYISGLHIQLNITYTSSLDDYGNTVYVVSSAEYIYAAVSGGTKLYQHAITNEDSANELYIVTPRKNPYSSTITLEEASEINSMFEIFGGTAYDDNNGSIGRIAHLSRGGASFELIVFTQTGEASEAFYLNYENITDTVTPL